MKRKHYRLLTSLSYKCSFLAKKFETLIDITLMSTETKLFNNTLEIYQGNK